MTAERRTWRVRAWALDGKRYNLPVRASEQAAKREADRIVGWVAAGVGTEVRVSIMVREPGATRWDLWDDVWTAEPASTLDGTLDGTP